MPCSVAPLASKAASLPLSCILDANNRDKGLSVVFALIKRWRTEKAERKAQAERDAADYQRGLAEGREQGAKIAKAVDDEIEEFSNGMIAVFTKRVAVNVIFGDDPTEESRACIDELTQHLTGDRLEEIKAMIRTRLSAWEQLSRDLGAHEAYETLLKDRFDGLYLNLWMKAINIAGPVVLARKEEMGLDVEDGENLRLGRKILMEARDSKITLSQEDAERLLEITRLLEATNRK